MVTWKTKLLLLQLLLATCYLWSQTVDEIHQKLLGKYSEVTSMESIIAQTNQYKKMNKLQHSEGKFYWAGNRMSLRYTSPTEQSVWVEGNLVTIYDKKAKVVMKSSLQTGMEVFQPQKLVERYWNLTQVKLLSRKGDLISLRMQGTELNNLKYIDLTVDSQQWLITGFQTVDMQGNSTTVNLKQIKLNKKIQPAIWEKRFPKGVGVTTIGGKR